MKKQLKSLEISVFCRDTAMMLAAGVAPEESISLLQEENSSPIFLNAVKDLMEQMEKGNSFAQAVEHCDAFPVYAKKMIYAGEMAGRLEEILTNLADYYERQESLHQMLHSALLYPVILLIMMCIVLLLLVAVVLPVFVNVYQSMSGTLAASSYRYIMAASVVSRVSLWLIAVISAIVLFCGALSKTRGGSAVLAKWGTHLPIVRNIMRQMSVAGMTEILSAFLTSGLDGDTAMRYAAETVRHPGLKRDADTICEEMQKGKSLAQALEDKQLFDPVEGRLLISASRSGRLDETLSRLASHSEQEAERRIQQAAEAMEPILTGFLTIAVGISLLSIMLPLVGILSGMG